MKLMITGHRPAKLGGYGNNPIRQTVCEWMQFTLFKCKNKWPDVEIISGMALGVDQWWAEQAYRLNIPVNAYLPFANQDIRWPEASRKHWKSLLSKAKTITIVSEGNYSPAKMQIRNEAMVDNADYCLAVWNGEPSGGTWNCIRYIRDKEKPLYILNPKDNTVIRENY